MQCGSGSDNGNGSMDDWIGTCCSLSAGGAAAAAVALSLSSRFTDRQRDEGRIGEDDGNRLRLLLRLLLPIVQHSPSALLAVTLVVLSVLLLLLLQFLGLPPRAVFIAFTIAVKLLLSLRSLLVLLHSISALTSAGRRLIALSLSLSLSLSLLLFNVLILLSLQSISISNSTWGSGDFSAHGRIVVVL